MNRLIISTSDELKTDAVKRVGFTLVELLVVIGIISVLMSIVLAAAAKVRDVANTTRCLANLKQIGCALASYANDHHGCLVPGDYIGVSDGSSQPGGGNWADILVDGDYITAPTGNFDPSKLSVEFDDDAERRDTILRCPSGGEDNAANNLPTSQIDARGSFYFVRGSDTTHEAVYTWYAVNCTPRTQGEQLSGDARRPVPFSFLPDYSSGSPSWQINRLSRLKAHLPLVFDGVWCFNGDAARINARHGNRRFTNILFADAHCETQLASSLPNEDWYMGK
jgi:prepilin-type N-terminal cleavage/methylation domain-containing protein/prepilin-type processing-associated H-X9-DG protein